MERLRHYYAHIKALTLSRQEDNRNTKKGCYVQENIDQGKNLTTPASSLPFFGGGGMLWGWVGLSSTRLCQKTQASALMLNTFSDHDRFIWNRLWLDVPTEPENMTITHQLEKICSEISDLCNLWRKQTRQWLAMLSAYMQSESKAVSQFLKQRRSHQY